MTLELGLQLGGRFDGGATEMARRAEAAGYSSLHVPDHLSDGLLGPLTACAALICATERIRVGPLVLNNDFRHPVVLAREVASLAVLSSGRFELGLGAGHMANEYVAAGLSFDPAPRRIDRLEESAAIIRGLLAGEAMTFEGDHYSVVGEQIRPSIEHAVPILIGGNSARLHAVAARFADIVGLTGFSERRGGAGTQNLSMFGAAETARQVEQIRRLSARHGRTPRLQVLVQWAEVTPNRTRVAEDIAADFGVVPAVILDSPYILIGTKAEIGTQMRERHERLGITRWTLFGDHPGGQPPCLETFAPIAESLAGD